MLSETFDKLAGEGGFGLFFINLSKNACIALDLIGLSMRSDLVIYGEMGVYLSFLVLCFGQLGKKEENTMHDSFFMHIPSPC